MTELDTGDSVTYSEGAMIEEPTQSRSHDPEPDDGAEPEEALGHELDGEGLEEGAPEEGEEGEGAESGDLFSKRPFALRLAEALLFASDKPVSEAELAKRLPEETDIRGMLRILAEDYAERGIHLVNVAGGWAFRTAPDLGTSLRSVAIQPRKLSRAAVEALAIIAYHQPVTRAEIEQIRGVALSRGTLEILLELGWIRPKGRRQTPGRPATWGTSNEFLDHFGLARIEDLPGVEELKAAGLLDRRASVTTLAMRAEDHQVEEGAGGEDAAEDSEESTDSEEPDKTED